MVWQVGTYTWQLHGYSGIDNGPKFYRVCPVAGGTPASPSSLNFSLKGFYMRSDLSPGCCRKLGESRGEILSQRNEEVSGFSGFLFVSSPAFCAVQLFSLILKF